MSCAGYIKTMLKFYKWALVFNNYIAYNNLVSQVYTQILNIGFNFYKQTLKVCLIILKLYERDVKF